MTASAALGFHESPVPARICIATGRALYVGPGLDLAAHMNVATTLAVALDKPFELRTWSMHERWSAWRPSAVSLIASQTLHHVRSSGPMAFLYFDPLTDRRNPPDESRLCRGLTRLRASADRIGVGEAFAAFGLTAIPPGDARIARVARAIEHDPDAFDCVGDAAAAACLSPSRFRTRFDAEVGVPFRRYRLWRRMAVVMRALHAGCSLTEAAMSAGFASSAHLSGDFRRMFGLAPSEIVALGARIDLSEDVAPFSA